MASLTPWMGRNFLLLLLLLPPSIFSPPTSDLQLLPLYPLLWSFIFPLLLALCLSSFISPSSPILCSLQALPTSRQGLHPRLSCPCEGLQRHLQAGSGTAAGSPAPGEEVGSCSASGRRGGGARPLAPSQNPPLPPAALGLAALGRCWHHYQPRPCLP